MCMFLFLFQRKLNQRVIKVYQKNPQCLIVLRYFSILSLLQHCTSGKLWLNHKKHSWHLYLHSEFINERLVQTQCLQLVFSFQNNHCYDIIIRRKYYVTKLLGHNGTYNSQTILKVLSGVQQAQGFDKHNINLPYVLTAAQLALTDSAH